MKYQRGVALSGLIFWSIVVAMIAVLSMKVVPTVIEFYKIQKDCRATVGKVGPDSTVADVKKIFGHFTEVDGLTFDPNQLDISKNGGKVVIEFAYEKRIPLFWNVSLLINYKGTSVE